QPSDVEQVRDERPLPLEAVLASPGMLFVQGFTLAPDVALLSLAVAHPGAERPLVVAALFRPDRLLRIVGASRMHETWIVDERGELVMHADVGRLLAPEGSAQHPLVREGLTARADRGVTTYARTDDAEVMLGAWSRVESARLLVLTQLPKRVALTATRELIVRSALFAAAVLLLALLASLYLSRRLTDPIRRLRAAAEQVGSGRFDVQLDTSQRDELGELAEAFAQMARALQTAQAQLIRSEKMAAFGQLGAGITHEVKNPVAGIVGLAQVAQKQLTRPDKVREILKLIESEGLRCSEILVNFLRFAREEPAVPERHLVDVNEVVTAAARMFSHQLAATEVSLSLRLAPDAPQVLGGTNELQQVLVNLAINAQQAMGRGGTVTIETGADDGWAWILFSDTGPGIPAHLRDRIFEPFFTTKQPGEGTGLG
ncbi:MAG: HAMP domain-containing protein, partial [Myxococcales bacterium]